MSRKTSSITSRPIIVPDTGHAAVGAFLPGLDGVIEIGAVALAVERYLARHGVECRFLENVFLAGCTDPII